MQLQKRFEGFKDNHYVLIAHTASFFIVVVTIALVALLIISIRTNRCKITGDGMGFNSVYIPSIGCRIEVEPNMLIPIELYHYHG